MCPHQIIASVNFHTSGAVPKAILGKSVDTYRFAMVIYRLEYLRVKKVTTASNCGIVVKKALVVGVTTAAVKGGVETVIVRSDNRI